MLSRETARIYAPSLIWAALMLLIAMQMWWSAFALKEHTEWTFDAYGVVLLQVALLYLASGLVLPDLRPDNIDLERDYFKNRRWFFGLLAGPAVASILKDVALYGQLPDGPNLIFHLVLIGTCVTAMLTAKRWYHTLLAPASLAVVVSYIALLFTRL